MVTKVLILGMIVITSACMNPQKIMTDPSKDKIFFGKSGGFTNIPMEYVLTEKGHLFKIEHDSLVKAGRINAGQISMLDSLFTRIEFDKLDLKETGNITYHIKRVASGAEWEVKWSDSSGNEQVKELYNALVNTTKKDQK